MLLLDLLRTMMLITRADSSATTTPILMRSNCVTAYEIACVAAAMTPIVRTYPRRLRTTVRNLLLVGLGGAG